MNGITALQEMLVFMLSVHQVRTYKIAFSKPRYAGIPVLASSIQICKKIKFHHLYLHSRIFLRVAQVNDDTICPFYEFRG